MTFMKPINELYELTFPDCLVMLTVFTWEWLNIKSGNRHETSYFCEKSGIFGVKNVEKLEAIGDAESN